MVFYQALLFLCVVFDKETHDVKKKWKYFK